MTVEYCFLGICFAPLDGNGQKVFGFAEFLAALALMVLAWTIADVRYRFRVQIAPIPLMTLTYWVVASIGLLTLLTDLWRAERWPVPIGNLLTPALWQAILGGSFLVTFLTWTWFAFIGPPAYGRFNSRRFAKTLFKYILKGSPTELAIIADELAHSARALVNHASNSDRHTSLSRSQPEEAMRNLPRKVESYADDILLLIADKKLCREIVASSPGTALAFFQAINSTKKYDIGIATFGQNIVNEALRNKDSFLYHETEGYESGLIGYLKPLSQAIFSPHEMVETIGTLLDPDIYGREDWDSTQWKAYCGAVLITFQDYVANGQKQHSFVLYRALSHIKFATSSLYKLNESINIFESDLYQRPQVVANFLKDAVKILDKKAISGEFLPRKRDKHGRKNGSILDRLAASVVELILDASGVKSPRWECWTVQHNLVWSQIFNAHELNGPASEALKFKVRRLLYDEIVEMKRFPNFKGAKLLRVCLNVMGLKAAGRRLDKGSHPLHVAILAWTKQNFVWLYEYNSSVGEDCLAEGFTFDRKRRRLVRTLAAEGLRREASQIYLELDRPSPEPK